MPDLGKMAPKFGALHCYIRQPLEILGTSLEIFGNSHIWLRKSTHYSLYTSLTGSGCETWASQSKASSVALWI